MGACTHEEPALHDAHLALARPVAVSLDADGVVAAKPPPLSEGVFPCSRCHLGGDADQDGAGPDGAPTLAHAAHGRKGLECEDCHFEDEEQEAPSIPTFDVCEECHDDLSADSERARAYFDATRQEDGTYAFPKRWRTQDVEPAHGAHWDADVECESCHGAATDNAFTKPRSVPLMERCVGCHVAEEAPNECATCHRETTEKMHAFTLHHAEEQRGCLDCHDAEDRDTLRLANGEPVSFEASYRLCGQCHGPKLRDWRLGLHGKRSGEWNGRQEYLLCAHCHDPHRPRHDPVEPLPAPPRPEDAR